MGYSCVFLCCVGLPVSSGALLLRPSDAALPALHCCCVRPPPARLPALLLRALAGVCTDAAAVPLRCLPSCCWL